MLFLATIDLIRNCVVGKGNRIIRKIILSCKESKHHPKMILSHTAIPSELPMIREDFEPWVTRLDNIEPGMMLVSTWRSDKFAKYVTGPNLIEEMEALMKLLDGEQKNI